MSAPEFVRLRPIPGNIVLAKAMLYRDAKSRELALFLQAMSMQPGGLYAVAEQLIKWFPERFRDDGKSKTVAIGDFIKSLLKDKGESAGPVHEAAVDVLRDYLVELAINPRVDLSKIECGCFDKLGDALQKFKTKWESATLRDFVVTTAGRVVMDTLDQAQRLSRMVVLEGNAGVGKSTNAKAWCAARPGLVRYISLSGITNRITFFQKIGAAIGLATCQRKAHQLQGRIEDYFARSKMMLVIDEAHFLWPQLFRVRSTPELVDWIDTALVNQGVPVALLATDQFSKLKNRVERSTGWTSEQFVHRVYRYRQLAPKPTREDVDAVARRLLSAVWDQQCDKWNAGDNHWDSTPVDALVLNAMDQAMPLASVASCVDEARLLALQEGRITVSKSDIKKALTLGQIPSEVALSRAFKPVPSESRRRGISMAPGSAGKPGKSYCELPSSRSITPHELRTLVQAGRNGQ
jgi:hypothetical protein